MFWINKWHICEKSNLKLGNEATTQRNYTEEPFIVKSSIIIFIFTKSQKEARI